VADLDYRAKSLDGPMAERMPWVVDVVLRILTDDGARMIAGLENGRIAGDWWEIALAHSHVFTRRVVVMVAAP
ncbi:MAG: prepilin-type N-terminal cleavage/methylation protein, partial [Verrucomicrobia bacterium]|nr:prepilin-type N-terminal cleavage/methylation protein [Verrucomicrobiota bacterium]